MRYAIIIEKANSNYAAYAPDVPGCAATGETVEETLAQMRSALEFHFEGLKEDNDPIPEPTTVCDYVELKVPV